MIVAYVIERSEEIPDPSLVTHIFYAFGNITDSYDSVSIPNMDKFKRILALKDTNPELKICLSLQTSPRDGFAVMTASDSLRTRFVNNCKKIVETYSLDGIDLDWEFPGTDMGMHQGGAPDDPLHYSWLARDLRKALGNEKLLSFYSSSSGKYNNFSLMLPHVDYVMMSGYNLGTPPKQHQCNLYPSKLCGKWSISKCLETHLDAGIPNEKIMLGIPFFARTQDIFEKGNYYDLSLINRYLKGYETEWDDEAKAAYYPDEEGKVLAAFDTPESINEKCKFISDNDLAGAFYWHYNGDENHHEMAKAVKKYITKFHK